MTISNRDKKLLVYLVAVAIVAAAYFFVFRPYMDKYDVISAECNTLQTKVNHLNEIYVNRQQYEDRIVDAELKYNEIISKFYSGLDQDRTLMMIDRIENNTDMWIGRVSFNEPEIVGGSEATPVEGLEEGEPVIQTSMTVTKQSLNLDYSGKYSDYKKFIEYLNNFDKRLFISSMTSSYSSETNEVSGAIVMSQFAIDSPEKESETPDLSSVGTGVENIFTTLTGEGNYDNAGADILLQNMESNEDTSLEDTTSEDATGDTAENESKNSDEQTDNNKNNIPEEQQDTDGDLIQGRPRRAG